MNLRFTTPEPEQMQDLLSVTLRQVHGADSQLEDWSAHPVSKRGKHRAVRYDLDARLAGAPHTRRYQWVGKFYEHDDDAGRVAAVLRQLSVTNGSARGGLVIPRLFAYHAPFHLLLLGYEPGESVTAALVRDPASVLPAIGHAVAALHTTPVTLDGITSPAVVLDDLRQRIADLSDRIPVKAPPLQHMLGKLERRAPVLSAAPSFLHGDLGPVQLRWQMGRIVVLDFDKWTRGDPALDLGNLLTQLRRLTLRKPGKLPHFACLRQGILDAYQQWTAPDPGLTERVAWYEQTMLLRKIHFLTSDTTRHDEAEAIRERQAEATHLVEELFALLESGTSPKLEA